MTENALENGYQLATYDIVASTNDEAKKIALESAPSGSVVWSRIQTGGRGRHGNSWISPSGNLYASILLRMNADAKTVSQLAFLTAIAVRDALPTDDILFKWPNDILSLSTQKLGGILLEAKTSSKGIAEWVVVGIGLNIENNPNDADVDRPATCLKKMGIDISADELLQSYLDSFMNWYSTWVNDGFAPIRVSWMENAAFMGETVTVTLDKKEVIATFKDINEDGELVILLPDGQEVAICAGELFLGVPGNVISD
jgi:BirA family biotin operon repressor/biotin-[acetyl-CoA-carboxylase] ligase